MSATACRIQGRAANPGRLSRRCVGSSRAVSKPDDERIKAAGGSAVEPDAATQGGVAVNSDELPDFDLMDTVRAGDIGAYGKLYQRHVHAAHNLARQVAPAADAADLVHEAFIRVLSALRAGGGPHHSFRAYLLTAVRSVAYDKHRRDRRLEISEDICGVRGVRIEALSSPFVDTAVAALDRSLAALAFAYLPERFQAVLWHLAIERRTPVEMAPIFGLTPNGVSALAYRARQALKQAFLQVQLGKEIEQSCRTTASRLGRWCRKALSARETAEVDAHLSKCSRCRNRVAELGATNPTLVLRRA